MESLERIIQTHSFFVGLDPAVAALLAGCARHRRFEADAYLFREGEDAREFFLLFEGDVSLEIQALSGSPLVLGTIHANDIVGASWLVPPYRWNSDARARTPVRSIGIDAALLRGKSEDDPRIGYALMKRFAPLLVRRLQSAHLQLLDIYGRPDPARERE